MNKKDFVQIKDIVIEALEPFANAVQGDFKRMNKRFDAIEGKMDKMGLDMEEVKSQLWKLERRVFAIEEMLTEHGIELRKHTKELHKIWKELKVLKNQNENKVDIAQVTSLEKRISALEAQTS